MFLREPLFQGYLFEQNPPDAFTCSRTSVRGPTRLGYLSIWNRLVPVSPLARTSRGSRNGIGASSVRYATTRPETGRCLAVTFWDWIMQVRVLPARPDAPRSSAGRARKHGPPSLARLRAVGGSLSTCNRGVAGSSPAGGCRFSLLEAA